MKPYRFDFLGLTSASLCMVHCAVTPFLSAILVNVEWLPMAAYLFFGISLYAVLEATKYSQNLIIVLSLWICLGFLLLSIIFEEDFEFMHYFNYAASLGLVVGHILNIRDCKKCNHNL